MRLVCISDTHSMQPNFDWPDGDILIHAGDLTGAGQIYHLDAINRWFSSLPYCKVITICGNHDWCFQRRPEEARAKMTDCIYLQDESVEIDGVKFYGSPWQPEFCNWAFNLPRNGKELQNVWSKIPDDTDVLITHGPPFGVLDRTISGDITGCEILMEEIERRIKPKVHVFGHIHEGYGVTKRGETLFVNASTCTVRYFPINKPIVIDLDDLDFLCCA